LTYYSRVSAMHVNTYYDLLTAFRLEGCPICRLVRLAVDSYLDSLDYEFINDAKVRKDLVVSFGFCKDHAEQWFERPRLLATCILYRDVVAYLGYHLHLKRRELFEKRSSRGWNRRLRSSLENIRRLIKSKPVCPVCDFQQEEEHKYLSALLQGFEDESFEEAYMKSHGLCLHHLFLGLDIAAEDSSVSILLIDKALMEQRKHMDLVVQCLQSQSYNSVAAYTPKSSEIYSIVQYLCGDPRLDRKPQIHCEKNTLA